MKIGLSGDLRTRDGRLVSNVIENDLPIYVADRVQTSDLRFSFLEIYPLHEASVIFVVATDKHILITQVCH